MGKDDGYFTPRFNTDYICGLPVLRERADHRQMLWYCHFSQPKATKVPVLTAEYTPRNQSGVSKEGTSGDR